MSEAILAAGSQVFQPASLLAITVGVLIGIVVGCVPGLNVTMGMILLLPFTFSLEPTAAVGLLMGIYISAMTAGAVPPVLFGIPGVPSSAATVVDGHALAARGQAGKALGTAIIVGIIGGILSIVALMFTAPLIAGAALNFGPAELFAVVVFGLAAISENTGGMLLKSLISGAIGLMLTTIGMDPLSGAARYSLGKDGMLLDIDLVVAMLGIFAIPRILSALARRGGEPTGRLNLEVSAELPTWQELRSLWWVLLLASFIGTWAGAVPGPGGPVAVFLAYDLTKRFSRNKDEFGKGALAGIAAPETANNALTGGALIPMLTLGVPGEPPAAVLMGGLLIHGLRPGPLLFQQNADFVYGLFLAMLVGNLISLVVSIYAIRVYVQVLRVPRAWIMPVILTLCVVGAYSVNKNPVDLYIMLGLGLLTYAMERAAFPIMPMVLGLVLGGTAESEFRRALILSGGNYGTFLTAPISLFFLLAALAWLFGPALWDLIRRWTRWGEPAAASAP